MITSTSPRLGKLMLSRRLVFSAFTSFVFLTCLLFFACADNTLEMALEYNRQPPGLTKRVKAVEMLLEAAKNSPDAHIKADLYRRIADAYWQRFNPATEQKDPDCAIFYYQAALSELTGETSLQSSKVKLRLAVAWKTSGNREGATSLLWEVIRTPSSSLYSAELSGDTMQRLNALSRTEQKSGIGMDSIFHKNQVAGHIARAKEAIDYEYFNMQKSAAQILAQDEFQVGGLKALGLVVDNIHDARLKQVAAKIYSKNAERITVQGTK